MSISSTMRFETLGLTFVIRDNLNTQRADSDQFYIGYLRDAAALFEGVIKRLNHCDDSQCNVADATDMAHRIKGNAAMYSYPELGLKAGKVEQLLRADTIASEPANLILPLIDLVDDILAICRKSDKLEPSELQVTLAVDNEDPMHVSQSTAVSVNRKSILLAYQDDLICRLIASLLEAEFNVICVNSAEEARQAIQDHKPDLIGLEDNLGDMAGLDFVKELKASDKFIDLPVFIAFSANSPELIAEALGLGVNGFMENKHNVLEFTDFAKDFLETPTKSILIVDDDLMVRELLEHMLTSEGFKVDTACDGVEALSYLANETPDLVLLDRFMPRLEGGSVLHEIQSKINLKSIPVLILTAMVNHGEAESWFQRGAADFIPKPFNPAEVLMRVKQHLNTNQRSV